MEEFLGGAEKTVSLEEFLGGTPPPDKPEEQSDTGLLERLLAIAGKVGAPGTPGYAGPGGVPQAEPQQEQPKGIVQRILDGAAQEQEEAQVQAAGMAGPGKKDAAPTEEELEDDPPTRLQKAVDSFQTGGAGLVDLVGGGMIWAGLEESGRSVRQYAQSVIKNNEVKELYKEFEWSDMADPDFYLTKGVQMVPSLLTLIPLAVGGGFLGGAVGGALGLGRLGITVIAAVSSSVASRPVESAMEAAGTFNSLLDQGASREQASEAAAGVFTKNMALIGMDAAQFALAFAKVPAPMRKGMADWIRRVGVKAVGFATGAASEGYEEVLQGYFQELGEQSLNGEVDASILESLKLASPEAKEAFVLGTIGGGLFQAVGTAKQALTPQETDAIIQEQIDNAPGKEVVPEKQAGQQVGVQYPVEYVGEEAPLKGTVEYPAEPKPGEVVAKGDQVKVPEVLEVPEKPKAPAETALTAAEKAPEPSTTAITEEKPPIPSVEAVKPAIRQKLPNYLKPALDSLPSRIIDESPVQEVVKGGQEPYYNHTTRRLGIPLKQVNQVVEDAGITEIGTLREFQHEMIAAWGWENLSPKQYNEWRKSVGYPESTDVRGGTGGGMSNMDTFAGSAIDWMEGHPWRESGEFFKNLFGEEVPVEAEKGAVEGAEGAKEPWEMTKREFKTARDRDYRLDRVAQRAYRAVVKEEQSNIPEAIERYGQDFAYENPGLVQKFSKTKPEDEVTIYRAVSNDDPALGIMPGDWVAIERSYAVEHGAAGYGDVGSKIASKKVRARDVIWAGTSADEWFYKPATEGYAAKSGHEALVQQALSEGKSIPPKVLAEYPDLAPEETKAPEGTVAEPEGAEIAPDDIITTDLIKGRMIEPGFLGKAKHPGYRVEIMTGHEKGKESFIMTEDIQSVEKAKKSAEAPEIERSKGVKSVSDLNLRPSAFIGNVALQGEFISDGHVMIKRSVLDEKRAKRLEEKPRIISGHDRGRYVKQGQMKELWQGYVREAKQEGEILGYSDRSKDYPGAYGQVEGPSRRAYIVNKADETDIRVFDADKIRMLQSYVGFNKIKISEGKLGVAILYKDRRAVALLMPVRSEEGVVEIDAPTARRALIGEFAEEGVSKEDAPKVTWLHGQKPGGEVKLYSVAGGIDPELVRAGIREAQSFAVATKKALERIVRRGTTHMRKLGAGGVELAKDIDEITFNVQREANNDTQDIREIMRGLTEKERIGVAMVTDNEVRANTESKRVVERSDRLRKVLDRQLAAFAAVGGERRLGGPGDEKIPAGGGGHAFPQVPNREGRKVLQELSTGAQTPRVVQAAEWLVEKGKAKNYDEAIQQLARIGQTQLRSINPYFERTRTPLPTYLREWDPHRVLSDSMERNWMTIEGIRKWGWDEKGKSFPKANELIGKIVQEHPADADVVYQFIQSSFGLGSRASESAQRISRDLRAVQFVGKIAVSPLTITRNMIDRFAKGFTTGGLSATLRATLKFPPIVNVWIKSSRRIKDQMIRSGAVFSHGSIAEGVEPGTIIMKMVGSPFTSSERGNQIHEALVAKIKLERDIQLYLEAKPDSRLREIFKAVQSLGENTKKQITDRIKEAGLAEKSTEELVDLLTRSKGADILPVEIQAVLHRAARDQAFPVILSTKRLWWDNSPMGKVLAQFKVWPVEQTSFIYRSAMKQAHKGNVLPLVRFIIGVIIAGELYNIARDTVYDKEESLLTNLRRRPDKRNPKDIAWTLYKDAIDGGLVGMFADLTWGLTDWVLGPTAGTVGELGKTILQALRRPGLTVHALKKAIRRDVSAVRQAEGILNKARAVFDKENRRAILYSKWRFRANEYWREENVGLFKKAEKIIMGPPSYPVGKNALVYDLVARSITANDIDGASDYIKILLSKADTIRERKEIRASLRQSKSRRSPLGPVPKESRLEFFKVFNEKEVTEAKNLQRKWLIDYESARSRAETSMPAGSGG